MGERSARPVVLDAGALVAIERADERIRALLHLAVEHHVPLYVPAPVVAEVWRGGAGRQAHLATFLSRGMKHGHVRVLPLDFTTAKLIGVLLARTQAEGVSVTDAMVAWCALDVDGTAYTGDPDDLRCMLPEARIRTV